MSESFLAEQAAKMRGRTGTVIDKVDHTEP